MNIIIEAYSILCTSFYIVHLIFLIFNSFFT